MRGEGRIDDVASVEQHLRAGEIGNIGRDFAREHRIVRQARDLRRLDFRVPVGAFDEADHETPRVLPREVDRPFAKRPGALLIGLDGNSEPAPAVSEQPVLGGERLEHVHLQLEPVGFLGIDRQMDVGRAGLGGKLAEDGEDIGLGLFRVAPFIARMKRGKLDRYAWRFAKPPSASLAIRSIALR